MKRISFAITLMILVLSVSNVLATTITRIENNYSKSGEPKWVDEIMVGMPFDDVISILDNNQVGFVVVERSLDDKRQTRNNEKIISLCIDLKPNGLAVYPSNYMIALQFESNLTDMEIEQLIRKASTDSKILSSPPSNPSLFFYGVSSLAFAFLSYDYFSQAKDIRDAINELNSTNSNLTKRLEREATRQTIGGIVCAAASLSGILVIININKNTRLKAKHDEVILSYSF